MLAGEHTLTDGFLKRVLIDEWDRIGDVQLCADGMPCTERLEIARWITQYRAAQTTDIPEMEQLIAWMPANWSARPAAWRIRSRMTFP